MSDQSSMMPLLTAIKVMTSLACAIVAYWLSYSYQKSAAMDAIVPQGEVFQDPGLYGWKSFCAAAGGFLAAFLDFQQVVGVLGLPEVPSDHDIGCAVLVCIVSLVCGMLGFSVCLKINTPWQVAMFGGGTTFTSALLIFPDVLRGFNVL
ncbi:hypothetical protein [Streptomyces sp. NBC_00078]|uniref:hypothetical protein n=1 Tax=unclassified Streptomyces TaxID=2593676 RepID=UPI002257BF29|nr:hypothetical protein [Streptomyces sp. NBC_00078]MCX5423984.1 hypothetical protein [Streptomyces sp. NBC_00078]